MTHAHAFVFIMFFVSLILAPKTYAAGATITYQGRIIQPDGSALNTGSVQFRIQIRSPDSSNCLMYEEDRTVPMAGSNGIFALPINGAGAIRTDAALYDFNRIFANKGTFTFPAGDCGTTNTFTPNLSSGRRITALFYANGAWEALPSVSINFVPYAIESTTVGGYGSGDLLRVDHAASEIVAPFSFADYGKLIDLASGKLNGSVLPSFSSGQVLGSDGAGGWTAVTPLTVAGLPACATGEYLRVSSGALVCQTIAAAASVTSITAGTGLTGGTITSSGTIALASVGSGGSGTKLTYDVYGRVTGASALVEADVPTLSSAGKVNGSALSGTIGNGTSISTSGAIQTSTDMMAGRLSLYDGGGSNTIAFRAPATVTPYVLTYPAAQGAAGQTLVNNGSGQLSWLSPLATVTNSASLSNAKIWIGDGSNKAQEVLISGDATVASTGALTLSTVSVGKGGTGLISIPTNGQILIGNGTGYALGTLTAGSGVSVVNSAGGITINATGSGGTVTNVSGTAPIAVATGTSTPVVSIAKSTSSVDGYLAATDFVTFSNKLGPASTFAGDVSGTSSAMSVDKIKGTGVTVAALASGQYLKYNGSNWVNAVIDAADVGTGTLSPARMPAHTGDVTSSAGSTSLTLSTVTPAKGGTGLTSIGTANQILGVNTGATGLEYKTLTAGAGVTITPSAGTLTINALGSGTVTSGTANQLAYYSGAGTTVGGLTSVNNSVLLTNGSGVPAWSPIANDSFTQYALLAGRAGGQALKGGTAASENLTLDSTSNATKGYVLIAPTGGNVGIGTTSPAYRADIMTPRAGGTAMFRVGTIGDSNGFTINQDGSSKLIYSFNNSSYGSAVGIGTTTPGASLDVVNQGFGQARFWNSNTTQQLWMGSVHDTIGSFIGNNANYYSSGLYTPNSTAASGVIFGADGSTGFFNNTGLTVGTAYAPTARIQISSGGNVGIGTTAPTSALQVSGTATVSASTEGVGAYVNSAAAYVIPDTTLNVRRINLTNSATITLPAYVPTGTQMYSLTVFLKQDATGSRAATFVGSGSDTVKWDSGTAPAISSTIGKISIVQFIKSSDETVWYGSMVWKEN